MASKGKSSWVKWLLILAVLLLVGGGTTWYFLARGSTDVQYQTTTVTRGDLIQAVTATGTLNPVTNVTVGSQISGIIQTLSADWNTPVKAGQVVAQLDPATYKASVQQAAADLANSKANLELSQIQADRADQLFANKLISASDHDTAIATLHQATATVQLKEASLSNAQVNLDRCTIYSPVDGTVISRSVDVGQTVAASLSAPVLFVIANDLTEMQIDANVAEADIGTVEDGMPVEFHVDAFPDRTFRGKVRQIRNSPTTIQNVVTYDTVISVNNFDMKLRPGMTANASIITARRDGVLRISNAALRFKPADTLIVKNPARDTNAMASAKGGTNSTDEAQLTGDEPPQELQRRVREMRDRGEDVPENIRAKLRDYYQNGVLKQNEGRGATHPAGSQPVNHTVYTLAADPATSTDKTPSPEAARIKTGISDGAYTEVLDGLKEGDIVVTAVRSRAVASASASQNPFGGPGMGGPRR